MSKGNGKLKGSNGKLKRKTGRPKAGEGISAKVLKSTAVKHDGSPTAVAKELGISEPVACRHLQKPEFQEAIKKSREKDLIKAGITRAKVFNVIGSNLKDKKNAKKQMHAIDKSLKLLGEDLSDENSSQRPIVVMPLITINDVPLVYDFIDINQNGKS